MVLVGVTRVESLILAVSDHDFHLCQIRRLGNPEAFPESHETFKDHGCGGREVVVITTSSLSVVNVAVAGLPLIPVLFDEHLAKGSV